MFLFIFTFEQMTLFSVYHKHAIFLWYLVSALLRPVLNSGQAQYHHRLVFWKIFKKICMYNYLCESNNMVGMQIMHDC
jgi:hypothetical protein